MECNKDEAIKAKQVAENKIRIGDFVGAQKFAHKAQRLYPELDNVSQILTVCEVHCSAQNQTLGSEKDWYGILQIERSADEATIKKQYRKLALLLHPDKNKFAGAEAAFKLIGEAHRVLSNSTTRSTYDSKCRAAVRSSAPKPQPQSAKWNSFVKKQNGPATIFPKGPSQYGATNTVPKAPSQFAGPHPVENAEVTAFWTSCSNCGMRYQYYRTFVNKVLRCQNCQQCFTAFDLGTQGMPPGFPWHQFHNHNGVPNPAMQNSFPNPGPSKVASQNNGGKPSGRNFFTRFDPVSNSGNASQAGGSSKTQEKVGGRVNLKEDAGMPKPKLANGMESGRIPKPNVGKPSVVGTSRNSTKKRKRKSVIESGESSESSNCDEEVDVEVQEKDGKFSSQNFVPDAMQQLRRSSRQRKNVLYNEKINDGDFLSSPKRSKGSKPDRSGEEELQQAGVNGGVSKDGKSTQRELKQKASAIEESTPNKKSKTKEHKAEGKEADISDCDDRNTLKPEIIEYPDPDFNDFDKDREENCFAVNQIWAIYDTCDGMPRFYAQIKKVLSPHFRLQITWLEPHPYDESEKAWCHVELPIACGNFVSGRTEETEDRLMFSHKRSWMNIGGRRLFLIYPKVGETWAIFSDWDIKWSSDPEKHKPPYQYEFVEVLTDFDENVGIGVAYLGKVNGFVSLFKQTAHHGVISFSIAPAHMYRFSHQIPSYRMTGKEREGVPVGSFEFDPASLPTSLNNDDPDDVQMEKENLVSKSNGLSPKSAKGKEKPTMDSKKTSSPNRSESDPEREHLMSRRSAGGSTREMPNSNQVDASRCINERGCSEADERIETRKKQTIVCAIDALRLRRSPRDLGKKNDQLNATQCEVQEEVYKHSDAKKVRKQSSILQFMGSVSSSRYNEKMHLHKKDGSFTSDKETCNAPLSRSTDHKIADAVFHDFKAERSEDKFDFDQIWALYSDVDGMPKNYAQVKIIETADFRLHVVPLEACPPSNALSQPVCCGTFIVKNGKIKVFPRSAFSHQVKADVIGENRVEIYPRKGQVWAVYKEGNSELAVSDRLKGECDIVEILEDRGQNIKVAILSCVNGYKSVYRIPRRQRSKAGFMNIPRADLSRFSHQIPAFQLTGEKNHQLRGCWNLDPLAIPGASPGGTIILD